MNLVVKPGYSWDPKAVPIARTSSPAGNAASLQPSQSEENVTLTPELPKSKRSHSRVPSVVLSPSPSLTATTNEKIVDIPLLLDASSIPTSLSATGHADSPYHSRLSQPAFWSRLHEFLRYVCFHCRICLSRCRLPQYMLILLLPLVANSRTTEMLNVLGKTSSA